MQDTYGERYALHAADGETPVASITGAAQYLMAVHVVCLPNYGHCRISGSDSINASAFARPNVAPLSHRERYRPNTRRTRRKKVTTKTPERQKSKRI